MQVSSSPTRLVAFSPGRRDSVYREQPLPRPPASLRGGGGAGQGRTSGGCGYKRRLAGKMAATPRSWDLGQVRRNLPPCTRSGAGKEPSGDLPPSPPLLLPGGAGKVLSPLLSRGARGGAGLCGDPLWHNPSHAGLRRGAGVYLSIFISNSLQALRAGSAGWGELWQLQGARLPACSSEGSWLVADPAPRSGGAGARLPSVICLAFLGGLGKTLPKKPEG